MNSSYILINNKKYVFKYENKSTKIFKEENNKLFELTEDEKKSIKKLFKNISDVRGYKKVESVFARNKNIEINKKKKIVFLLKWLESIIPEDCKDYFYWNLETLSIDFSADLSSYNDDDEDINKHTVGFYDTNENKILIAERFIYYIYEKATRNGEFDAAYFKEEYDHALLHEMIHMASSLKKDDTCYSGFDYYYDYDNNAELSNAGITEGLTEAIAIERFKDSKYDNKLSAYSIEVKLAKQLILLIGKDVMYESYFRGDGIFPLEFELTKLGLTYEQTYSLFRNIENNFLTVTINRGKIKFNDLKIDYFGQTFLTNAQDILLTAFENKLFSLSEQNNYDEINRLLNEYRNCIVTNDDLERIKLDSDTYIGLDDNILRFNEINSSYFSDRLR